MIVDIDAVQTELSNVFQTLEKLEKGFNFADAQQRILWGDVYNLRQELTKLQRILKNEPIVQDGDNDDDDGNDYGLRTVICPHCDHYQKVDDSIEYMQDGTLEVYKGELEDWEIFDGWAFFVVKCDICRQRYKMQSNNVTFNELAGLEDEEEDE